MNIVTLIRIEDGVKVQGFLDWDPMGSRMMNFYHYDEERQAWVSLPIGKFKPVPIVDDKSNVIGG